MKICLCKIGKPNTKEINNLVENFQKRLRGFAKIDVVILKDTKPQRAPNKPAKKVPSILEGLKKNSGSFIVVLDERGVQWSSPQLAEFIQKSTDNPQIKSLTFVVGGPYGLGDEARKEADLIWSLSNAVFPSEIAWFLLWEQIYRAFNIIKGTPYHHE